jgi:hypothetical protein
MGEARPPDGWKVLTLGLSFSRPGIQGERQAAFQGVRILQRCQVVSLLSRVITTFPLARPSPI